MAKVDLNPSKSYINIEKRIKRIKKEMPIKCVALGPFVRKEEDDF